MLDVIRLIIFIFFIVFGIISLIKIRNQDLVGSLLIVEQDGEDPVYMLEIYQGKADKIKPGNMVVLAVDKTKITQKKQPS